MMNTACLIAATPSPPDEESAKKVVSEKTADDCGEDALPIGDGGSTRADESDSERTEPSNGACVEEETMPVSNSKETNPFNSPVASRDMLLRFRWCAIGSVEEPPPAKLAIAAEHTSQPRGAPPTPPRSLLSSGTFRAPTAMASAVPSFAAPTAAPAPSPPLLSASPTSWAAARQRRQQEGESTRIVMERSVRSTLNKLTVEKFEELYLKLLASITHLTEHVDVLASEIFKKATVQHHFTAMYADLCARLDADLEPGVGGKSLRDAILSQCRQLFTTSWDPPAHSAGNEDADQESEAQALRKKAVLGNLRFIGELLVRSLLPLSELLAYAEDLQQPPQRPEKLEALAALLTVVGPVLDTENGPLCHQLKVIFWDIRGLTFNPAVPKRIRCLLQDVLDLRDSGWVDMKVATRDQGPKGLEQLRHEANAELTGCIKLTSSPRVVQPCSRASSSTWPQSPEAMHACIGSGASSTTWPSSPEAASCISSTAWPSTPEANMMFYTESGSLQEMWPEVPVMDAMDGAAWPQGAMLVFVPMELPPAAA